MNPETIHPEIKDMTKSETFIEYVFITKPGGFVKVNINKIIPKDSIESYLKEVGIQYGGDCTNLSRISK
jgi:hypothetical protein